MTQEELDKLMDRLYPICFAPLGYTREEIVEYTKEGIQQEKERQRIIAWRMDNDPEFESWMADVY